MRIIGGFLKGRLFEAPAGSTTRPTTDSVREAIFSALGHHMDLDDVRVVDGCCGSGAMAFESISRGAAHALLIDIDASVCRLARENARALGIDERVTIARGDVADVLSTLPERSADLVIVDPPYAARICNKILGVLSRTHVLTPGGVVIMEHDDVEHLLPRPGWSILTTLTHGGTAVDLLRHDPISS